MRGLAIVVLLLATLYGTLHWYCFTPVVFGGAVLITGASSGIGRDAAFYLAERNFTVFASYRKEADGASLTKEAKERGLANKLIPIALDVLDESSIQKAIDAVRASQLPLVALINNAGIGGGAPLELEEEARLRAIFEANYFGALKMVRHALPLLRKAKGRVVSISSLKGSVATPGSAAYSSSKAALDMAMRVLALEVHHQDIRVVTVQPGYIKSEIRQKVDASYVAKANQLAEDNIKLYPGFYRNMKDNFTAQRGVDPVVTSKCIHSAISARYPGPLLRAGGWEVVTATWLPWLIPDWVEDDVSAGIFRYDKTGEEKEAGFVTRFKKTIGV